MARKIDYKRPTTNIWFPTQVEPDPADRANFTAYWKREKDRIRNGFYLANGQVYISGWLYWHTVYWVIELDMEVNGRKFKQNGTPVFRDLEWEVSNDLLRAEKEGKIYCLVGSRGFGKSNICASVTGHTYNFFASTECVVSGGFANDIKLLTDKVDLGLSNSHPVFHQQRLLNNWKYEVRAGWKDSETGLSKGSNSRISVRNYEEGAQTMAANGTRPKVHIIDEIGKIPNLANCVLDTMPCWKTSSGEWLSIPILAGTGGDMEKGADAAKIFRNPRVYEVLEFDDVWEGSGKIGKFVPVTKALNKYKAPMKFSKYLGITHPDLDRITIMVSEEQRVIDEFVTPRRERAMKSTTSNEIIKEKAYYPLTPSESFLVISANDFPVEACQKHKQHLANNDMKPLRVELFTDLDGRITHKYTDKMPVTEFPVQTSSNKEGVVEIVEHPVPNAPYGLYVAGIDPYKQSESDYSDSLGSVYIFKRMTDNMMETYQYMPVAWYTGRPKSIHTWYENVRNLLKWYNAVAMCENADYGFIQYMIEKNETMYLAEGQSFLKEISPNSKHKSTYGLPPTPALITHWLNSAVIYCKEELEKERDDKGRVTRTALGVSRILDPMLLEEMVKFNKNEGNFDRVRSFGIALAYAKQLDSLIPKVKIAAEQEKEVRLVKSPFSMNRLPGKGGPMRKSPFIR